MIMEKPGTGWKSDEWPLNQPNKDIYLWGFWKKENELGDVKLYYSVLMKETLGEDERDEVLCVWKHDPPLTEEEGEKLSVKTIFSFENKDAAKKALKKNFGKEKEYVDD